MNSVGSGAALTFLLAAIMAVAGSLSQWVWLPLSAPINGMEVTLLSLQRTNADTLSLSHGIVLAAMFSIGALLAWFGLRLQAFWVLLGAFAILVYFPVRMIFVDDQWVETYLLEALDRSGLQRFLHSFFLPPNRGGELAFIELRDVEYLSDRSLAVSYFLGWGWSLALVGCLLMMFILSTTDTLSRSWIGASLLTVVLIQLSIFGSTNFSAEFNHRQADERLSQGKYQQALVYYERAFRGNPSLKLSMPTAIKVSKAYYQLNGEDHYFSQLYLADLDHSRRRFGNALLRLRLSQPIPPGYFKEIMLSNMRSKHLVIELEAGLIHFVDGNLMQANDYFQFALSIHPDSVRGRMYMARLRYDLQDYTNSLTLLKGLLEDVYHPSFQADFHSSIGDALNSMGQFSQAREAYLESYELDSKDNYRAVKGLSGT